MPHHKSAAKRVKTNEKARLHNAAVKTRMRTALKAVRAAATRGEAEAALRQAVSILDRTAAKGIIRKDTASRYKARLALFAAKLPA
jgi:small subunit ribosomal protein S20